jgi:hypothetical protein
LSEKIIHNNAELKYGNPISQVKNSARILHGYIKEKIQLEKWVIPIVALPDAYSIEINDPKEAPYILKSGEIASTIVSHQSQIDEETINHIVKILKEVI